MSEIFNNIGKIKYEGASSVNPLSFKFYDAEKIILGKITERGAEEVAKEIRDERARELFGEFQRKYDLVRWDIWYDSVNDLNDYQTILDNIKPCHRYYPIPDTEVAKSKYVLDNKEYEQYGI